MKKYVTLGEICKKGSSNIAQKDIENNNGNYAIYGASGYIKNVDFYHQEKPYIAVVKDGAGIGRTMLLPEKTSVIGTLQYLIPSDLIFVKYLYYAVTYMNLSKYFTGATIPHIYFKDYQKEILPLPSIEKQQEIAENLEKVDTIIKLCNSISEKMDVLVQSRFIELFGTYPENDKGWDIGRIRDVITEAKYGSSRPASVNGKYLYLRMNNITYVGELDLTDVKKIDVPESELSKCTVKRGDVLFNRTNSKELVGKTCVYNRDEMMVLAGFVIRIRTNEKMLPEFLSSFLNTDFSKRMLFGMCKTAIGQANINAQELQNIGIYIPPTDIQQKFVLFKDAIDKSKLTNQKSLEKLEILKKSLMQQYFG